MDRCSQKDFTLARQGIFRGRTCQCEFMRDVLSRIAYQNNTQRQSNNNKSNTKIEWLRPDIPDTGDLSGRQRRDGGVAGEFVDTHRESTFLRAGQVDLHDDHRRPGEPLAYTQ